MLIHAYKRKEATPIDTGNGVIEFTVNDAGDVVAGVDDEADLVVLMGSPEAFKVYNFATADVDVPAQTIQFVLKGATDEPDLDLSAMTEDELKAFAKVNSVQVHHTWTGDKLDKLRQKLVDTFAAE